MSQEGSAGQEPGAPEVVAAPERQLVSSAGHSASGREVQPSLSGAAAELERGIAALPERHRVVATARLFAREPETLAEVGRRLGVTRERARQIEVSVRSRLTKVIDSGTGSRELLTVLRDELKPVASMERLVAEHPALETLVPALGVPVWLVLARLVDDFEVRGGWAAAPSIDTVVAQTREAAVALADEFGVASQLAILNSQLPSLSASEVRAWLEEVGFEVRSGHVMTRRGSTVEFAVAALSIAGRPMHFDDLVARLGMQRRPRSIRNVLFADDRFIRTDRDEWALTGWGRDGYTSIRKLIQRELDDHGGETTLADLCAALTSRFTIAANSVAMYAHAYPYQVRDGLVRRAETPRPARTDPYQTRRLFRFTDGWQYRVQLTHDHFRGSSFQVPSGVAAALGCMHGDLVRLPSRLGEQIVRWTGPQPTVASIRRFLLDLGCVEGETVFLRFDDAGTFDLLPTRSVDPNDPLEVACSLAGLPVPNDDSATFDTLTTAVGLSTRAPLDQVMNAYRDRGDDDIHGAMTAAVEIAGDAGRRPPPR